MGAIVGRDADGHPAERWAYSVKMATLGTLLFAIVVEGAHLARSAPVREPRVVPEMAFPGESWEQAAPETVGMDSRRLARAVAWFAKRAPSDGVDELVIVRHGRLVWAGPGRDKVHGTWSMTKSFSGIVLGLLAEEGVCDPDMRVATLLPELESAYSDVTLCHLATMRSGYQAVGEGPSDELVNRNGGSATPFIPAPKPQFAPGTHFSYWDSAVNLLGLAMTRAAGESMRSVFQRRVAGPIGIPPEAWTWRVFSKSGGIAVNGGSGNKGKHVEISARDLARIGHLMLNRGLWDGQRIIGSAWIDALTTVHVPADLPPGGPIKDRYGPKFPLDGRGVYGIAWWVNGIRPDGKHLWPGVPAGAFGAKGHNNNRLFVIPEWDMVVVRLGLDQRERRIKSDEFAGLLQRLGRAIED